MSEARPYASLSSGLLARKGAAKPAMRPQSFGSLEDLGWNDMGYAPAPVEEPAALPEHVPSSIAALTPAPKPQEEPSVVAQQRAIADTFHEEEEEEEAPPAAEREAVKAEVVALPKRKAPAAGKKTAFTLRLDAERHLRLRLACAVTGRSAQQIVTGALDEMLATLPEVEALATRVPAKAGAAGAKRS